eukprot:10389565-Alexandrium_andersonii.AAC.1
MHLALAAYRARLKLLIGVVGAVQKMQADIILKQPAEEQGAMRVLKPQKKLVQVVLPAIPVSLGTLELRRFSVAARVVMG